MLALVTDSSAALTREEARRLGVEVVPMTYTLAGGEVRPEAFMGENGPVGELVEGGSVTATAGVAAEAFAPVFRRLAETGSDVLCITISSKLSSTYRHACDAADQVRSELRRAAGATSREAQSAAAARTSGLPRLAVFDSQGGVGGMELLARHARALAEQGLGFDELLAALEGVRARSGICFSVASTDGLRSSGRMALVPLSVGTLLNRFPVLTVTNGAIAHQETAHGTAALARAMVAQVPERDADDLVIMHYGSRGNTTGQLLRAAKEAFPGAAIRVKEGGPVLSSILGPGAVSISWGPSAG
jgi:DegV family protein with EDD domain